MSSHQPSQPRVLVSYTPFHPSVDASSPDPAQKYGSFDEISEPNYKSLFNVSETRTLHEAAPMFKKLEKPSKLRGQATYLVISTFRLYPSTTPLYLNDIPTTSSRMHYLHGILASYWHHVPILLHLGGNDSFAPHSSTQTEKLLGVCANIRGNDDEPIPDSSRTFASLSNRFWLVYPALSDYIKEHKISGILMDVQEFGMNATALALLLTQLKSDFGEKFIICFVVDLQDLHCCSPGKQECAERRATMKGTESSDNCSTQHSKQPEHSKELIRRRTDLCVREVERLFGSLSGGQKVDFYVVRFAGRVALRQLRLNLKNYGDVCASVQDWCAAKRVVAGLAHMYAEDAATAGSMRDEVLLLAQWYRNEFGGVAGGIDGGVVPRDLELDFVQREETVAWAMEMKSAINEALEGHHNARE